MPAPRVLILTTSHAQMGDTGKPTGVWAEELTTPYYALLDGGADITLASVRGGSVPFDPGSLPGGTDTGSGEEPSGHHDVPGSVTRFFKDETARALAQSTPPLDDIAGEPFDAIFLPGGHGTMWDLPDNQTLARLIGTMFDAGKVVAAVCHGPAGLVSARRSDGRSIVAGRRATAFTNSEETAVGLTDVVPFLLEDRLKELGADWEAKADWQPHAVRDGNLVTGQNPQSSELVVQHVLEALRG